MATNETTTKAMAAYDAAYDDARAAGISHKVALHMARNAKERVFARAAR